MDFCYRLKVMMRQKNTPLLKEVLIFVELRKIVENLILCDAILKLKILGAVKSSLLGLLAPVSMRDLLTREKHQVEEIPAQVSRCA